MTRALLSTFQAKRQAFCAVQPLSALVVLDQTLPAQQDVQAGRAKSWPLLCQLAQPLPNFMVGVRWRRPPERSAIQAKERARPALRIVVLVNHLLHNLSVLRGRTHFFPRTSFKTWMSSA